MSGLSSTRTRRSTAKDGEFVRGLAGSWTIPAAAVCLLTVGFVMAHLPGLSGDTVALVHGAHTIAYCLSHGIDSYCDRVPAFVPGSSATIAAHGIVEGAVAPYPLFQYVPALLLTQLGMSDTHVYEAFSIISAGSFCALVALIATTASRTGRRWAAPAGALIVTASPLIFYAWSTFGESLAALSVALLTAGALRRWPPVVLALCACAACLTKETIFPIVAILGAVSLWATPIASHPLRRAHWVGLGIGTALGIALAAVFDWFRYGQLTNYTYGHSFEQVPGVARRLSLSVALWIAPNGGVAWFWPLAVVAVLAVVVMAIRSCRRQGAGSPVAPALGLVIVLLIVTGTLASWYAPFGWIAWGPRLMLPVLPSVVLVALTVYSAPIERVLRVLVGKTGRAVLVGVIVVATALPQVNVLHARQVIGQPFAPDPTCPVGASPVGNQSYYYRCLNHWAWGRAPIVVSSYQALETTGGLVFAVVFGTAWLRLVWLGAASVGAQRPYREAQAVVTGGAPER